MKILILGSGLIGPAAAFNAMSNPEVSQVIIADASQEQLQWGLNRLQDKPGADKLGVVWLDLNNQKAATRLMANFEAIVAALPQAASPLGLRAALQAGKPLIDLTMPPEAELPALQALAEQTRGQAILACGLEPGLTEIVARHLAEQLDRVDELHIKCGGIPERPTPPLGYKIVFGGKKLPLRETEAREVIDGQLRSVPRYSGVEPVTFGGVGECEAYHEGFMPWLLELPEFRNLKAGTQKTVRWPGYAAKVTVLKEMGLLSQAPIQVNEVEVVPKQMLDALLYDRVRLGEGEGDITTFRVELLGQKTNRPYRLQADMVDRYDPVLGFTSMARTTAFTGAIVAQMAARGDLPQKSGLIHPEQVIHGPLFDRLLQELAAVGIQFQISGAERSL